MNCLCIDIYTADPAAVQQWPGYLASQSRAELVVALLATPEAQTAQ